MNYTNKDLDKDCKSIGKEICEEYKLVKKELDQYRKDIDKQIDKHYQKYKSESYLDMRKQPYIDYGFIEKELNPYPELIREKLNNCRNDYSCCRDTQKNARKFFDSIRLPLENILKTLQDDSPNHPGFSSATDKDDLQTTLDEIGRYNTLNGITSSESSSRNLTGYHPPTTPMSTLATAAGGFITSMVNTTHNYPMLYNESQSSTNHTNILNTTDNSTEINNDDQSILFLLPAIVGGIATLSLLPTIVSGTVALFMRSKMSLQYFWRKKKKGNCIDGNDAVCLDFMGKGTEVHQTFVNKEHAFSGDTQRNSKTSHIYEVINSKNSSRPTSSDPENDAYEHLLSKQEVIYDDTVLNLYDMPSIKQQTVPMVEGVILYDTPAWQYFPEGALCDSSKLVHTVNGFGRDNHASPPTVNEPKGTVNNVMNLLIINKKAVYYK